MDPLASGIPAASKHTANYYRTESGQEQIVDQEFDLRPYVEALLSRWWWLLGVALLAGILAFGISYLIPPNYAASALLLVVDPREVVQFDPRFEAVDPSQPTRTYPELATSDAILGGLLAGENGQGAAYSSLEVLREHIEAQTTSDPALLRLTVIDKSPDEAARLVNRWAELVIERTNTVLGEQGNEQLSFYQDRLAAASDALSAAETSLSRFQEGNRSAIVLANLQAVQETYSAYVQRQSSADLLLDDVRNLRTQIASQDEQEPILLADEVAALSLQMRTFSMPASQPLTFELTAAAASETERAQLLASLDSLAETLESSNANTAAELTALEPQILALQAELESLTHEENRLRDNLTVASETYSSLARKVAEEEITSQDNSQGLRLASAASVPQEPASPNKVLNALLAALVALVLLSGILLFRVWRDSAV